MNAEVSRAISMNIKDSKKSINPAVVIGGAVAVVVLVAVLAAVTGTGASKPEPAQQQKALAATPSIVTLTKPSAISSVGSAQNPQPTPTSSSIQYRPALATGTPMQPGVSLVVNYSGGQGSQMAQIFKGAINTEKYDVTSNLEQTKTFTLANQSAKLEVIAIGYILAPTAGDYTISVMETCEASKCQLDLFLDDTMVPLISGESGGVYLAKVSTPYTVSVNLQAGYHKLKITQNLVRPNQTSAGNARVFLKGPADGGLLDALVYLPTKT